MKITIIGCGHAGTTVAADLALKGHEVTLLKTSNAIHNEHYEMIKNTGKIIIEENNLERIANVIVSTDERISISESELVIIYIQTNYHEELIKKISGYLRDGQIVLAEPGYLSTCYLLKYCSKNITIVEAESSPIDCRIISPGRVKVLFRNTCNPVGVFPKSNEDFAKSRIIKLGFPFEIISNVVEAALHNPNLIVHTVGAIFSIPRIEYVSKNGGSYSMYREVFTPHIWNLVQALDNEKVNVLKKLGCRSLSYVEACKHRNSIDNTRDATEVFFDYANNSAPSGPDTPDSRYIMEDVPQGLVLLESLGKMLQVGTPISSSLIDCASALLNRNFRAEGRTVDRLGRNELCTVLSDCGITILGEERHD